MKRESPDPWQHQSTSFLAVKPLCFLGGRCWGQPAVPTGAISTQRWPCPFGRAGWRRESCHRCYGTAGISVACCTACLLLTFLLIGRWPPRHRCALGQVIKGEVQAALKTLIVSMHGQELIKESRALGTNPELNRFRLQPLIFIRPSDSYQRNQAVALSQEGAAGESSGHSPGGHWWLC